MKILFSLIFLACAANWFFVSIAAKSAMHETTGAVVGLAALVALGIAAILDAIDRHASEIKKLVAPRAQPDAETTALRVELSGQLQRLAKLTEHSNALLKWIGENQPGYLRQMEEAEAGPGGR